MSAATPMAPDVPLRPLRAFIIDSVEQSYRICRQLRNSGFALSHRMFCGGPDDELAGALAEPGWDIVVCGHAPPDVDARQVLEQVERAAPELAVIIVSDAIDDDQAAEWIRIGASDVVPSGNRGRLSAAVERAWCSNICSPRLMDASHQLFKEVVDHMPVGAIVVRWERPGDLGAFRFEYWNAAGRAAARTAAGYELVGKCTRDLPALMEAGVPQAYATAISTGEVQTLPQLPYHDENFGEAVHEIRVAKLDEQRALVLFQNITDRLDAERKLRAAQRMDAIGRLAGGIAHDYNNVLTVVLTHARLARREAAKGSMLANDLDAIVDSSTRASRLTQQLLAFGRLQPQRLQVLCISRIVVDIERMLRRLIGEDIALQTKLDPQLGQISIDTSQLEQVLMNLAVNARDAMPDGGRLTIEAHNDVSYDDSGGRCERVVLSVTDTGTGMDERTLAHACEPCFTTKPAHRGTGLGLSTVYGIVKQNGGEFAIVSALDKGTTVTLSFPRVYGTREEPLKPAALAPIDGHEKLLLVEDAVDVRRAMALLLRSHGYEVICAETSQHAIELCNDPSHKFAAMISDLVMPQMNGDAVARRVATSQPDMKVVFVSGYAASDASVQRLVQKPFEPDELVSVVREVLNEEC